MEKLLRARLDCARLALDQKEGPAKTLISSIQAAAVAEILANDPGLKSATAESRAKLVDLAATINWAEDDHLKMLELLKQGQDTTKTTNKRSDTQHFAPSFLSYFTEEEWEMFLGSDAGRRADEVFDSLVTRILALGGRCLSERSLQCLTTVYMVIVLGLE